MMGKAARKDFYMEIRKSPGRFLSIFFIVALGVAFFSGIRASEPDMRITGDFYFDESELMDIKALSTYGVTEKDVRAMAQLEGVEKAEGAYSGDFLYNVKDEQHVVHVMSLQRQMNRPALTEGRFPADVGECLADDESGYRVGDRIKLESGTDDPVSDTLKTEELEVVGLGNSPCYLSYGRGSTTIGTGSIDTFLIVPEDAFDMESFTEVYLQASGAKEMLAFTDEYDNNVEKVLEKAEELSEERGVIRKREILDEANEKIQEAKDDLAEGKAEAEKELKDAREKINDAKDKLDKAKDKISDGKQKIEGAKNTLKAKQKELDKGEDQYKAGKKKLKKGKEEYKKGFAQFEKNKPLAEEGIKAGQTQAAALKGQIEEDESIYNGILVQEEKLKEMLDNSTELTEEQMQELTSQIETLAAQAGGLKQKIEAQKKGYEQAVSEVEKARASLDTARKELEQAKKELKSGEKELKASAKKLKAGQAKINSGWKEIEKQEKKLKEGEEELKEGEVKLKDARREYKDGERKAKEEISDGEKKITDAEEELSEIEDPKWYVYDRNTLVEYSGFGENAERLGAIGRVFPVLFFLVAALISLTSMTRMVEEQRTSIGTMKALGYGKFSIASKYLGYAFLATIGGSITGVLAGEKILPYIIVYAYGILYRHLPEILVPYDWGYGIMASGAAIFCTMLATFMACYKELAAQPAQLMRPPAPKNGRRVFMERLRFLWKHLSFTRKSTIRNLMRYKKRFFMTVFGIGGCMALMLVGFGLKDSCYEIAELQYTEIQMYDGSIYLEEDVTDAQRERIDDALKNEPLIDRHIDVNMQNITLVNGKKERAVYECVFKDSEMVKEFVDFHNRKTKESYVLADGGVIVSEKTAKLLEVSEGDVVSIKDEDAGMREVKISHICENYMGHYMYLTPSYYKNVYGKEPKYNSILFAADNADKQELERCGQNLLSQEGILSVGYTHDIEKQLADMLRSLNLVIVVLIVSAGMLAFVVLYNLNTVNIAERKRELATLKVLGFYDGEVAEYVYRENIILTFIGALVGTGLGNILHRFIIETVEVDSAMFGRQINLPSYMYSLVLTIVFSLLINGVMYFKLEQIDMVESLKSVE